MTLQPTSYSELSSPVTAVGTGGTPARQLTEPFRELASLALLAGNAVFLLLGIGGLLFVIDGWADQFGQRCAALFGDFVGLVPLGLPMVALVLATHVAPMVLRARLIAIAVLIEFGVSALFGAITFLGAFAHDLTSTRATIDGLLERGVWLTFLVLACVLAARVWLGLFAAPRRGAYAPIGQPSYGRPYPGQPVYPPASYAPGIARAAGAQDTPITAMPSVPAVGGTTRGAPTIAPPAFGIPTIALPAVGVPATRPAETGSPAAPAASAPHSPAAPAASAPHSPAANATASSGTGWPAVPPPPMPAPLILDADPTTRIPVEPRTAEQPAVRPAQPGGARPSSAYRATDHLDRDAIEDATQVISVRRDGSAAG